MRRDPKPAKSKEAKPPVARKSPKSDGSRVRDLEKRLAEALSREKEGQEQQAATAEILRVISQSPANVQPVFDAVAENAARLCDAFDASIYRRDFDRLLLVAKHGPLPVGPVGEFSLPLVRGTGAGRAVLDGRTVHVADMQNEANEFPESTENARRTGFRTILVVPLMREGAAIGTINLRRTEVQPFTERQVALLQTFADQAVIAIENVRLFTETKEALEQQTATAEILRVISSSPTDLQPVMDAVAKNAARLCAAHDAAILRLDGDVLHSVAHHGPIPYIPGRVVPAIRGTVTGRSVLDRQTVQVADLQTETEEFPESRSLGRELGYRTILSVPLLREGAPVGAILLRRTEVQPFTDKQIALLKTFADQAVIAIENVRLFEELQEKNQALTDAHAQVSGALERQTATSEILRVISSSPTDAQPVFEAIARSAVRLCGGIHGGVLRLSNELLSVVALENLSETAVDVLLSAYPLSPDRAGLVGLAIRERNVIHSPDVERDPRTAHPLLARRAGYSSALTVPILRSGDPIGVIFVTSTTPFVAQQIDLLKTFADQAVIAIENVRLFTELQTSNRELTTALDTQTATSDILRVISQSPTDIQPAFDAIVESAHRLLNGFSAIVTRLVGDESHLSAFTRTTEAGDTFMKSAFPMCRWRTVPCQHKSSVTAHRVS
jgi:two-component system NtrC family sensor kinase